MDGSEQWLAPAIEYVADWLRHQVKRADIPGCSIAIAHRGEVVLVQALGMANLATGEALTTDHHFRVASHAKTFTAAGVLKLRDAGRVRLDDAIGEHVAGLHSDLAGATIGQLLGHAAGVVRDGEDDSTYWSGRRPFPDEAELTARLALPPTIPAATRFKYSNLGYAVAGRLIETVTREPYVAWMQREVVDAAGLTQTTPDFDAARSGMLASGHSDKSLLDQRVVFPGEVSTGALAAAAGFVSTPADLCRFFSQLSPNAPWSILSVAARREMTRGQWRDPYRSDPQAYGLGLMCGMIEDWDWFGHGGGFQGYLSKTTVAPAHDLAVSVLTNSSDGKGHAWADGVLTILRKFKSAAVANADLSDWSGRWWNVWGPVDLVAIGERVLLASPDAETPFAYAPELIVDVEDRDRARIVEANGFHHFGETVRLRRNGDGQVVGVWIAGDEWVTDIALRRALGERYGKSA